MKRALILLLVTFCLCSCSLAQSLSPNADSEVIYDKTIRLLNTGQITAGEAHLIFMRLIDAFEPPSSSAIRIHGSQVWKLAVLKESAYFHRLSEAAIASLIEDQLGRAAAESAWAQQLQYANIYKAAKAKLNQALK